MTLGAIAHVMQAQWRAPADADAHLVTSVCTDSRTLTPGSLFIALRGEHFDGHAFVASAWSQGVGAVVVDDKGAQTLGDAQGPVLVVADTLHAYGALAQAVLASLSRPVVGITGSNGKTSTKELLAAALATQGPVHRTAGNLNNLIGLPKTALLWPDDAWAAVLEMGMNAPGEIARLTAIAQPRVRVITCVAAAHLQGLGTLAGVAAAKTEILAGLGPDAIAVLNGDDEPLMTAAAPYLANRTPLLFGRGNGCTVQLIHAAHVAHQGSLGLALTLQIAGATHQATLPLVGLHNAMNAAAAVAAAMALGVTPEQSLSGMQKVVIPGARGRIVSSAALHVQVLDDCYNANPHSMQAALATLQDVAQGARTVAVMGDMLELGAEAEAQHAAMGQAAAHAGVAHVFAVGAYAAAVVRGAQAHGVAATAFADVPSASAAVRDFLQPLDWCLVKGSRGMRLERLVDALTGASPSATTSGAISAAEKKA